MSFFCRWQDAVVELAERLRRQRVLPGENIVVEESADGVRIHAANPGGSNDESPDTFGYFSMSYEIIRGNWIWTCYDSAKPDSGIAGYVCVGAERIAVPVNTFYNPRDCSVYVKIIMDSDKPDEVTGMSYSYRAVLTWAADDVYGVEYIKIGRFVYIGGYESKFYREADLKIVGYV